MAVGGELGKGQTVKCKVVEEEKAKEINIKCRMDEKKGRSEVRRGPDPSQI